MLSTSIFSSNGSIYHQSAVFGTNFHLNQTALDEIGLPALTGSNAWANLTANLAVSFDVNVRQTSMTLNIAVCADWWFGRSRYIVLGAICRRFVQVGIPKDTTRSSLSGTII